MNADTIVVGAGIVGAACAYFLAREGQRVIIVERGGIASGTSGAGEGNILLSDKAPGPELDMARLGCALWEQLARELPDDFEYEQKGSLVVAEHERQLDAISAHVAAMRDAGVVARLLDAAELRDAEPHLARDLTGASYFPGDAQVQPMMASAALIRSARRHGTALLDHTAVTGIDRDARGCISGVITTRGHIRAPRLVVAAGPWSAGVAALAGVRLPIQPRKGHIVVTEPLPKLVHHKVVEASYADAVNSGDAALQVAAVVEDTRSGTILLGSSRQLAGFDAAIEVHVLQAIVRRAIRFFPVLASVHALRAYAGFRAFTPDHVPVVGEIPSLPGCYVASGHEGAGICLGPISGKLLCQLILGRAPELDIAPFSPARFEARAVASA